MLPHSARECIRVIRRRGEALGQCSHRCRANMAHVRQPRPKSGLGNMKCAPHNALKSIVLCKLTFDERVVLHPPDHPAPARWGTTLSPKVNLHHAINFRALCGAKLVTLQSKFRPKETRVVHRVGGGRRGTLHTKGFSAHFGLKVRYLICRNPPMSLRCCLP